MNQNDILRIRFNRGIEPKVLHGAMDQHAKNISIAFLMWLVENKLKLAYADENVVLFDIPSLKANLLSIEEVYDLFIESLNNKT